VEQTIEYRQRWNVADAEHALGREPHGVDASLEQRQAWRHATRAVGRLRDLVGDRTDRGERDDQREATSRSDHRGDRASRRGDHEAATGRSDRRGDHRATTGATAGATAGDHLTANATRATSAPCSRWSHDHRDHTGTVDSYQAVAQRRDALAGSSSVTFPRRRQATLARDPRRWEVVVVVVRRMHQGPWR